MKLPQDLQPLFIHPTLVVAGDHVVAKIYLVGGDDLEELDGVSEPKERRSDDEGSFTSFDSSRHGNPTSHESDEPRLKTFGKKIAERITALVREQEIAHLHFVMPTEVDRMVQKDLPPDVKTKIVHVRHLDLMKEDPLTILRRVYDKE